MNSASKQSTGDTKGEKSLKSLNFSPGTIKLDGLDLIGALSLFCK